MSLFDEHRPCACRKCKPVVATDHSPELSETWRAVREQRDAISTLLWGAGNVDDAAAGVALKGIVLELDTLSARLRANADGSPRSPESAATERQ